MVKRKRYTAKELDAMTERLIARGEGYSLRPQWNKVCYRHQNVGG